MKKEILQKEQHNIKHNPAKNEKGNPTKGTAIWHKINNIIRIKTLKGNFYYRMENSQTMITLAIKQNELLAQHAQKTFRQI